MTIKGVLSFLLRFAVLLYIAITLLAYFNAEKLVFHPHKLAYEDLFPKVHLKARDGASIFAFDLKNPTAKYTILYSHGNAEDLNSVLPVMMALYKIGFSVLAYDYHGYGESTGQPSEANAYADEEIAYEYLRKEKHIPSSRIVAYGRSLGSALAADLASKHQLGGLILESPFLSIYRVLIPSPVLLFDRFTTYTKLNLIHCPLLVLHGREDEVVPFWHGQTIYAEANSPKMKYWVEGAHHNDLSKVAGKHYAKVINTFRKSLPH